MGIPAVCHLLLAVGMSIVLYLPSAENHSCCVFMIAMTALAPLF